MRASTRRRVSAPTSAHPLTTLETVITLTSRSRAMSFKRTGGVGAFDMAVETRVYQVAAERVRVPRPLARMDFCGGMVKLVYTEALKASSPQGECGFDSHSRYQNHAFASTFSTRISGSSVTA